VFIYAMNRPSTTASRLEEGVDANGNGLSAFIGSSWWRIQSRKAAEGATTLTPSPAELVKWRRRPTHREAWIKEMNRRQPA
jgi:hypothetical protein